MSRLLVMASGLALCALFGLSGTARAATYCAKYVGGHERVHSGARSQCNFSSLDKCRASVRARGGGTCYRKGHMR